MGRAGRRCGCRSGRAGESKGRAGPSCRGHRDTSPTERPTATRDRAAVLCWDTLSVEHPAASADCLVTPCQDVQTAGQPQPSPAAPKQIRPQGCPDAQQTLHLEAAADPPQGPKVAAAAARAPLLPELESPMGHPLTLARRSPAGSDSRHCQGP